MPYKTKRELPDNVQNVLPAHAQDIYKEAFNSAWEQYKDKDDRRDDASRATCPLPIRQIRAPGSTSVNHSQKSIPGHHPGGRQAWQRATPHVVQLTREAIPQ